MTFSARLDQLNPMLHWIRDHLSQKGLDGSMIRKIELASEEALINIINHAYRGKGGDIDIDVRSISKGRVEIQITDRGPPFNPIAVEPSVNPLTPLEEREEGGLGILFMKQYMDEIFYERKGNKNILTLVKKIS